MENLLPLIVRLQILTLTLALWLLMYFMVNRLQVDPAQRRQFGMPLDQKIPFVPHLALVYFSTYLFVVEPFFIIAEARLFYWMFASFAGISIVSSAIHAGLPSKIERMPSPEAANGLSGWLLGLFQRTCKPYGSFPSMHVGLSVPVVAANFVVGGPWAGALALLWALMIALSTLFTKQHTILDVLAGVLGGLLISGLLYRLLLA